MMERNDGRKLTAMKNPDRRKLSLKAAIISLSILIVIKNMVQFTSSNSMFSPMQEAGASLSRGFKARQMCHETCCVTEQQRVIKPFPPRVDNDSVDHSRPYNESVLPTVQDRIGIYETMEYLPEIYFWMGETDVKPIPSHPHLTKHMIPCLQPGTILLVKTKNLAEFFGFIFPLLKEPFVLFTMNGDEGITEKHSQYLKDEESLILHWYASNCEIDSTEFRKLTCIPVGFAHHGPQRHLMDDFSSNISGLTYHQHGQPVFPREIEAKRTGLVMASFNLHSRWKSEVVRRRRRVPWNYFCGAKDDDQSLWQNGTVLCKNDFSSLNSMYEVALRHKFMVSPHGVGVDCYRTWEALFLGMIPIVKKSTLDPMYQGLPVLIIDEWSDVNLELLERTWSAFQQQKYDFHRLYISYWQLEMAKHRSNPHILYNYSLKKNVTNSTA